MKKDGYKLSDYNFELPGELIAQTPAEPRDSSRLLCLRRSFNDCYEKDYEFSDNEGDLDEGCSEQHVMAIDLLKVSGCEIEHKRFFEVVDYFKEGDVLVMNNSRVFPARLVGLVDEREVEVFLLKMIEDKNEGCSWQCFLGGMRGEKIGVRVEVGEGLIGEVVVSNGDGTWMVKFNERYKEMMEVVLRVGKTPLPPYIKNDGDNSERYQTVYADDSKVGSVAAPTAGMHFTEKLLERIRMKGVKIVYITLHVGLGTFASVKVDDIREHEMHAEFAEIESEVIGEVMSAKKDGRRVLAVGTTSVRVLEAVFGRMDEEIRKKGFRDWVNIFIYPGYEFLVVDGMITNFHIPKSSLVMLVSAFAGKDNIMRAYYEAIEKKYKFYSYGDCMLIV